MEHVFFYRHLDISQSNHKYGQFENPNKILSDLVTGLPQLVSLDIGGTNLAGRGVAERLADTKIEDTMSCLYQFSDIPGLASRIHKPLQFLGLYGTSYGACRRHDIPAKVVSCTLINLLSTIIHLLTFTRNDFADSR